MAECEAPQPCPGCGAEAGRAWLTAPALGGMSSQRGGAFVASECDPSRPSAHASGCACCAPRFRTAGGTANETSKRSQNA
jgi:hypothetical protein